MKLPPAGTILTPRSHRIHGTCSILGRTYPENLGSLRSPLPKFCPSACFRKGSRGGMWKMPRDTWRHVTHTIVVPALWRIEWAWSRPDPTIRSAAIDESAPPALPLRPAGIESVVAPPLAKFVPNVTHYGPQLTSHTASKGNICNTRSSVIRSSTTCVVAFSSGLHASDTLVLCCSTRVPGEEYEVK